MVQESSPKLSEVNNSYRLEMRPSEEQIPRLCTLLQKGCFVKVKTGCSLSDLLCDQFLISPDYIKNDIKVIFLDYSPVDNLDTAIIKDGSILALSAAMPGLVGAAMRRDGLSWMRTSITYQEHEGEHDSSEGIVHVKLFNQVMADLGESFLKRGVFVKAGFLAGFLGRFAGGFWDGTRGIVLNGDNMTENELIRCLDDEENWVNFSIC